MSITAENAPDVKGLQICFPENWKVAAISCRSDLSIGPEMKQVWDQMNQVIK